MMAENDFETRSFIPAAGELLFCGCPTKQSNLPYLWYGFSCSISELDQGSSQYTKPMCSPVHHAHEVVMVTHSEEAIVLVDDQEFVIPGTLKVTTH